MALACPRCAQPLTAHRTSTATLEGCLYCGGIFLDRESRNCVVAARCKDTAQASDLAASHARSSPDLRARIGCPVCKKAMSTTRVAGEVELDVCDDHGAWFDRHELRRFIDALSAQRPKDLSAKKKKGAPHPATGVAVGAVAATAVAAESGVTAEDAIDVADAGFTVLELVGELLGALAD